MSKGSQELIERVPFQTPINLRLAQKLYTLAKKRKEDHPGESALFYHEQLTPTTEFMIRNIPLQKSNYTSASSYWSFQVKHDGEEIANIACVVDEMYIDLPHRLVRSQAYGISGTMFLQKVEEYLAFLKWEGEIPLSHPLRMEAGQFEVIQWALKNGFSFHKKEAGQLFDDIALGKRTDYVTGISSQSEENERVGYIMQQEQYEGWSKSRREAVEDEHIAAKRYSTRFDLRKPHPLPEREASSMDHPNADQ